MGPSGQEPAEPHRPRITSQSGEPALDKESRSVNLKADLSSDVLHFPARGQRTELEGELFALLSNPRRPTDEVAWLLRKGPSVPQLEAAVKRGLELVTVAVDLEPQEDHVNFLGGLIRLGVHVANVACPAELDRNGETLLRRCMIGLARKPGVVAERLMADAEAGLGQFAYFRNTEESDTTAIAHFKRGFTGLIRANAPLHRHVAGLGHLVGLLVDRDFQEAARWAPVLRDTLEQIESAPVKAGHKDFGGRMEACRGLAKFAAAELGFEGALFYLEKAVGYMEKLQEARIQELAVAQWAKHYGGQPPSLPSAGSYEYLSPRDIPTHVYLLNQISRHHGAMGQTEIALEFAQRALAMIERADDHAASAYEELPLRRLDQTALGHLDLLANQLFNVGDLQADLLEVTDARATLRRAERIMTRIGQEGSELGRSISSRLESLRSTYGDGDFDSGGFDEDLPELR